MENNKIVLIGGGGHCYSVLDTILQNGNFSEIVITDSADLTGTKILGCEIVGDDGILPKLYAAGFKNAFITVGSIKSPAIRQKIKMNAEKIGFSFPVVIDSSAVVSKYTEIGQGSFIGKNAVVNAGAVIGDFSIINTGVIIGHRCEIGEFCHVAVGATVCGDSIIGKHSFVGANATIIQCTKLGENSIIGAGSVVLADVPEGGRITGVWKGKSS